MAIRLVQVGMGSWGENWGTHVIQQSGDVELVACVDLDAGMLEQARQLLNLPAERCFLTLESALASVETDAVLITASLPAHVPVALESLNAGKHVLLEKPFAPTVAEAQQVVETAAQRSRVLKLRQWSFAVIEKEKANGTTCDSFYRTMGRSTIGDAC